MISSGPLSSARLLAIAIAIVAGFARAGDSPVVESDVVRVDTSMAASEPGAGDGTADAPFQNALDPQEDARKRWDLAWNWSGANSSGSSRLQSQWNGSLNRVWYLGRWTPSAQAGWSRSSGDSGSQNLWDLGLGLDLDVSDQFTWENSADWQPVENGPDDWTAGSGLSWSDSWGDVLSPDASVSGTWGRSSRGDVQAQLGLDAQWEHFSARASGTWDRRYQTFEEPTGTVKSNYGNVWGWWLQGRLKWGSWSTGPVWSGDYCKVGTSASSRTATARKKATKAQKVDLTGIVLNQEFRWNLTWSPLPLLSLSADAFRTTGSQTLRARTGSTALRKATMAKWDAFDALPTESEGVRLSVGLSW